MSWYISKSMRLKATSVLMGEQFITESTSEVVTERLIRASLSQIGSHVACADGPVSGCEFLD